MKTHCLYQKTVVFKDELASIEIFGLLSPDVTC